MVRPLPHSTLFPYTTLFRSKQHKETRPPAPRQPGVDRETAHRHAEHGEEVFLRFNLKAVNEQQDRSEEHTSELQSPYDLVCRLLLEKKKQLNTPHYIHINVN